jgi:hypothetical protein
LITSATKKGWLESQVERFNAEKGGNVRIEYLETRDALQAILNGKQKPTLWSPSAPLWATRLSEKWAEDHGGDALVSDSDPNTYRIYLRTPDRVRHDQTEGGVSAPPTDRPASLVELGGSRRG